MTFATQMAALAPSAWYRMNETGTGTSTMFDASGNSRDGSHVTVGIGAPTFGLLAKDTDGAIFYNGSTSYSEVPDAAWMDAAAAFSVHALIQPSTVAAANQTLLARYNGTFAQSQFTFRLDGNKISCYIFVGSGLGVATGATAIPAGTISEVGATYDGTNIRVFLNGVQDGISGTVGPINSSSTPMRVGRNTAGSNEWYTGWADEVAIGVGTVWTEKNFTDLWAAARGLAQAPAPILRRPLHGLIVR